MFTSSILPCVLVVLFKLSKASNVGLAYCYYFFYLYDHLLAGREETLTEHVLYWNKQKVLKLARSLSQKFVKVG